MIVAPGALLTVSLLLVNLLAAVVCLTQPGELAGAVLRAELLFLATNLATGYCGFSALGLITVLCEWNRIRATRAQKLGYVFTFPAVHDDVHPSGCGSAAAQSGMEAHCAPQRAARRCAGLCAAPVFGGSGSGENCEKFLNLWQIGYPFSF